MENSVIAMDISSRKLPLLIIGILIVVLVAQYMFNDTPDRKYVDIETCELWMKDDLTNGRQYLGEYDSKCMDFKNLNK